MQPPSAYASTTGPGRTTTGRTPSRVSKHALEIVRFNAGEYPSSPRAQVSLGDALARNGDVTEAEASYRRALTLDPTNREARGALAKLQVR